MLTSTSSAPVCTAETTVGEQRQAATLWIQPLIGLTLAGLITIFLLRSTASSMVTIWYGSNTYSYGFVVVPIVAFLVWRVRKLLGTVYPAPSLFGLALVLLFAVIWTAGNLADVQVVQQFAFVGLLDALVWAFLGSAAVRTLRFALLFLFFAVPAGQSLVGPLQRFTAVFAVSAVRLSGVPAVQDGLLISTPSGDWKIAEACSGIRYLTSSVLIGVLFAGIAFRSWKRRLAFVAMSLLVPILANAVRAYLIILLAYFSNNRIATGVDHVLYGWAFFSLVTAMLIGLALGWREPPDPRGDLAARPDPPALAPARTTRLSCYLILAVLIILSASYTADSLWSRTAPDQSIEKLWAAPANWLSSEDLDHDWAPHLQTIQGEVAQTLTNGRHEVSLYIVSYPAKRRGVELVNASNAVEVSGGWDLLNNGYREATVSGETVTVAEYMIARGRQHRLVWMWYLAGGRLTANPYEIKMIQAESRLAGRPCNVSLVAVSAVFGSEPAQAADELAGFVRGLSFPKLGNNVP